MHACYYQECIINALSMHACISFDLCASIFTRSILSLRSIHLRTHCTIFSVHTARFSAVQPISVSQEKYTVQCTFRYRGANPSQKHLNVCVQCTCPFAAPTFPSCTITRMVQWNSMATPRRCEYMIIISSLQICIAASFSCTF
mmetsp:Transcript_109359/g.189506  ORF Transcript_109359/g.189506 Transcript_109359/m.189506 type:complete len:143 (+) Transcript_109359:44-472(+)